MWVRPRQIAWFLASLLLHLAVKFAFLGASFIPYVLPVDAGPVLLPLSIRVFGPSAVWAISLASFIVDGALSLPLSMVWMRALGWWVSGAVLLRFLRTIPAAQTKAPSQSPMRTGLATCMVAIAQAGWGALVAEHLRWYSLGYVWFLGSINHLAMITLVGIPLYRLLSSSMIQRLGDWGDEFPLPPDTREPLRPLSILYGIVGLGATLLAFHFTRNAGISPFRPTILGLHAGVASLTTGLIAILLQFAALLWPSRRIQEDPAAKPVSPMAAMPAWHDILKR